jgi:hypothetical protein
MKAYTKLLSTALVLGTVLFSCGPDKVAPRDDDQFDAPSLGTSEDHPIINPVCSDYDTLGLMSQAEGALPASLTVNYNCTSNCAPWGSVQTYNSLNFFVAIFRLSTGWVIDVANSEFALLNDFNIGPGGVPITDGDWESFSPNPDPNTWQLIVPITDFQRDSTSCFAFSAKLSAVRRNFLGGILAGSRRTLWTYNDEYNDPNSENFSPSPFIVPTCWQFCPPLGDTICSDLHSSTVCRNLMADMSSLPNSAVTYEWSNGSTAPLINVCPAAEVTYYTVTITATPSREPLAVQTFCVPALPVITTLTGGVCYGCRTSYQVTFNDCDVVTVTAVCKDLVNIRVGYSDCTTDYYPNLTGRSRTYTAPPGKTISAVWVKAGCQVNCDCQNCGPRFDNPACTRNLSCNYNFN